jgi:hypothetical protein
MRNALLLDGCRGDIAFCRYGALNPGIKVYEDALKLKL